MSQGPLSITHHRSSCRFHIRLLCFLDAYSRYHQIRMKRVWSNCYVVHQLDWIIYCYVTMPFRLKNTELHTNGACSIACTCKIGWNIEAYVDDIVIKSKKTKDLWWPSLQESIKLSHIWSVILSNVRREGVVGQGTIRMVLPFFIKRSSSAASWPRPQPLPTPLPY